MGGGGGGQLSAFMSPMPWKKISSNPLSKTLMRSIHRRQGGDWGREEGGGEAGVVVYDG